MTGGQAQLTQSQLVAPTSGPSSSSRASGQSRKDSSGAAVQPRFSQAEALWRDGLHGSDSPRSDASTPSVTGRRAGEDKIGTGGDSSRKQHRSVAGGGGGIGGVGGGKASRGDGASPDYDLESGGGKARRGSQTSVATSSGSSQVQVTEV